jgi:hypothetical protein
MLRMSEDELKNIGKGGVTKPKGPTESEIQRAIKQYLSMCGWFVVKIHQSMGSYKGIADLYALKDGSAVWIEVKTPTGKQSEYQKAFEIDIIRNGGRYLVASGIEDVIGL